MNTAKRFAGRRVGCWGAEEKGVWRVTVIEMYYIYIYVPKNVKGHIQ